MPQIYENKERLTQVTRLALAAELILDGNPESRSIQGLNASKGSVLIDQDMALIHYVMNTVWWMLIDLTDEEKAMVCLMTAQWLTTEGSYVP